MKDLWPWLAVAVVAAGVVWALLGRGGPSDSVDARALVAQGAVLIDVRTPDEFASGHIDGARNIPFDEIGQRAGEIGLPTQPVVLYCRSGGRSAAAAGTLRQLGFTEITDIGAMRNW